MTTTRTITAMFAMGLSAVLLTSSPAAANLWIAHGGNFGSPGPANGQIGAYSAPTGFTPITTYSRVTGLAFDGTHAIAYLGGGFAAQGRFVVINPVTGAEISNILEPLNTDGELFGNPNPIHLPLGDLAVDPTTGTLYAAASFGSGGGWDIYTVDPLTGARTLVGGDDSTTFPGTGLSIAFNSAGELYAMDQRNNVFAQLDKTTGLAISSTTLTLPAGASETAIGLGFDPTSGLFVASFESAVSGNYSGLMTIDPNNGFATALLGDFEDDRGIHDIAYVIPEPATAALLSLGGLAMLRRGRRAVR